MKKNLLSLICGIAALGASAQIHFNAGLETSHLWRGLEVSSGVDVTSQFTFSDKANHFNIGFWGGMQINKDKYKEFDYFASYSIGGFTVALWDIWNFTDAQGDAAKIFNYNCRTTSHFFDLSFQYNFGEKVPLTLYWSTIIGGKDRGNTDGEAMDTQRYSTFVQASYKVYEDDKFVVTPSVGGNFAFKPTMNDEGKKRETFYGNEGGINDVRLNVTYKLKVGNHEMPITGTAMWNPQANRGYYGVAINLLTL